MRASGDANLNLLIFFGLPTLRAAAAALRAMAGASVLSTRQTSALITCMQVCDELHSAYVYIIIASNVLNAI